MHKDYILETLDENPWHFISGIGTKNESSKETIQREVKRETNIHLTEVEFLGSIVEDGKNKHFYHTRLTDDNVNNMVGREGKILGFFSLKEVDKLLLSLSTKLLIRSQRTFFENVNVLS